MAEYIEREAAIALYEDDAVDMSVLKVPVPVIIQNLKDVQAADVVPKDFHERCLEIEIQKRMALERKRGEWINQQADSEMCSACGVRFYISALFAVGGNNEPNYCPNCGALMKDGDGE